MKQGVCLLLVLAFLLGSSVQALVYGQQSDTTPPAKPQGLTINGDGSCDSVYLPLNWDPKTNSVIDPSKTKGGITPKHQDGYNLCWAAVTEMAIAYGASTAPTQCDQASNNPFHTQASNCCALSPLKSSSCDATGWPQFGQWNYHTLQSVMLTKTTQLSDYLCKKRTPVLYALTIVGGTTENHLYLVYGYKHISTGPLVYVIDPNSPDGNPNLLSIPFDPWFTSSGTTFTDNFGGMFRHMVNHDYMDICPAALTVGGACPIQQ